MCEEDDDDDAAVGGAEEYTWAGETRVRATTLLEGPLARHGFQKPSRGDETEEVDIDGMDEDGDEFGQPQYP